MAVKKYKSTDIFAVFDGGFNAMEDLVNEDASIVAAFDVDRGNVESDVLGNAVHTMTCTSLGTLTFKYFYLSDAKIKIFAQMNLKATGIITIKNLAQTTDLIILSNAIVKKVETSGFGRSGETSPTVTVTFHGVLTMN